MGERSTQLQQAAEGQLERLGRVVGKLDPAQARRPCPGRAKLGDGSIAAVATHTVDNYGRIADLLAAGRGAPSGEARQHSLGSEDAGQHSPGSGDARQHRSGHSGRGHGLGQRLSRWMSARGHRPPSGGHGTESAYTAAGFDLDVVARQVVATRERLSRIAALTDGELDSVPPTESFRFCDGQRTLEQVLGALLNHQAHQLEALESAVETPAGTPTQPGT